MTEKSYAVVSDLHGRDKHVEALRNCYGDEVQLIVNGDTVDSPDFGNTARTIDLLIEMGAISIAGNHEWVQAACMYDRDEYARMKRIVHQWLPRYEKGVLRSYGIEPPLFTDVRTDPRLGLDVASDLRQRVNARGHQEWFEQLRPYVETDEFFVIHGGLSKAQSVQAQTSELDAIFASGVQERDWDQEPDTIFDPKHDFSEDLTTHPDLDQKVLVTGHAHSKEGLLTRVTDANRRVRLASRISPQTEPLYVWQSWTKTVVPISPKPYDT